MRQRIINLYQFDELSDEAKEQARDWWRRGSASDSWWHDATLEDAATILGLMGFDVDPAGKANILYSGFSSQGDGACFTGTWCALNAQTAAATVKDYAPVDETLHRIAETFQAIATDYPALTVTLTHQGRYYHDRTITYDFELDQDRDAEALPGLVATEFADNARAMMRWIYQALEAEWDYQNSDEHIDETIKANEYEFTEDGHRA